MSISLLKFQFSVFKIIPDCLDSDIKGLCYLFCFSVFGTFSRASLAASVDAALPVKYL